MFKYLSSTYHELEERFQKLKQSITERESVYENRAERAEVILLSVVFNS